jgi:hypothetical protein
MKAYEGVEAWLPTFLTLVLDGVEKSVPYSSQFTAEALQHVISVPDLLKTLLITDSEYTSTNCRN